MLSRDQTQHKLFSMLASANRVGNLLFDREIARDILTRVYRGCVRIFPETIAAKNGTVSMGWTMRNMKKNGLCPRSVIDVGAYVGAWTTEAKKTFPDARFLMIEAQPAKTKNLLSVQSLYPEGQLDVEIALLGSVEMCSVDFFVMETGSSFYPERTNVPRSTVTLPMETLDRVVAKHNFKGPFFLKIDVQGAELDVLRGSADTLSDTDAVLMEVAFLPYNEGSPQFNEIVDFMDVAGFAPYDVCSVMRRKSDLAAFQLDLVWVRKESQLRSYDPRW